MALKENVFGEDLSLQRGPGMALQHEVRGAKYGGKESFLTVSDDPRQRQPRRLVTPGRSVPDERMGVGVNLLLSWSNVNLSMRHAEVL